MKFLKAHLIAITVAASLTAHASTLGTRGGGNSVDIDGRPTLRDLVDNSVCSWMSGQDLLAGEPYLEGVYRGLGELHFSYRAFLRNEAIKLNYCFTEGDLTPVNTEDANGLTILNGNSGDQVAIRWEDQVYIDRKIYQQMDARSRAFLIIHETMHSFIPMDVRQRNSKLRSVVRYLADSEFSRQSLDTLLLHLRMNDVTGLPQTAETLTGMDRYDLLLQAATNPQTLPPARFQASREVVAAGALRTIAWGFIERLRSAEIDQIRTSLTALMEFPSNNRDQREFLKWSFNYTFTRLNEVLSNDLKNLNADQLVWLMNNLPNELFESILTSYDQALGLNRYLAYERSALNKGKAAGFIAAAPVIFVSFATATILGQGEELAEALGGEPDFDKYWEELFPLYFMSILNAQPQNLALYVQNLKSLKASKAINLDLKAYLSRKDFEGQRRGVGFSELSKKFPKAIAKELLPYL